MTLLVSIVEASGVESGLDYKRINVRKCTLPQIPMAVVARREVEQAIALLVDAYAKATGLEVVNISIADEGEVFLEVHLPGDE